MSYFSPKILHATIFAPLLSDIWLLEIAIAIIQCMCHHLYCIIGMTKTDDDDDDDDDDDNNGLMIIAVSVLGILLIIENIIVCCICFCKKKRLFSRDQISDDTLKLEEFKAVQ